ncbi:hypothetical protein ACQY0O_002599 [Thecaphora frezii]
MSAEEGKVELTNDFCLSLLPPSSDDFSALDATQSERRFICAGKPDKSLQHEEHHADAILRSLHSAANSDATLSPQINNAGSDPHEGRSIVLCFDGTGDKFDHDNTNVVKLFAALKKGDSRQLVYYQPGIGTYARHGRPGLSLVSTLDMMFGTTVNAHIKEGYRYLMQRYENNDRISIFGFSRGAYTARALAAMVHIVGILPPYNTELIDHAFKIYQNSLKGIVDFKTARDFKRTFSTPVQIQFVGCWDTVSSVGLIPRKLPGTNADVDIKYFRHCLALDEHRGKFKQRNWIQQGNKKNVVKNTDYRATKASQKPLLASDKHGNVVTDASEPPQVLETWFAGCHADVGGGATENRLPFCLSRIPLRWMIRQCFACDTHILFCVDELKKMGFSNPDALPNSYKPAQPHTDVLDKVSDDKTKIFTFRDVNSDLKVTVPRIFGTPDDLVDVVDAMTRPNDQLYRFSYWWLLEFWPIRKRISFWGLPRIRILQPNLGRPRMTGEGEPKKHWTALLREQCKMLDYKPKAKSRWMRDTARSWGIVN